MRLDGEVALITGGTGSLGKAVVRAFLEEGARVALTYRDEGKKETLAASLEGFKDKALFLKTDVTQAEAVVQAVHRTVEQLGKIDILVNIVGGYAAGTPIAELEEAAWDSMMDVNLKSAFLCCRAVLPHMLNRKKGRIINVSSRQGLKGAAKVGPYSVSKAGLITLTEVLAEEVKREGITANVILPSIIDTEANRKSMPQADFSRWVKPEEIAALMLFLASPEAASITGAAIPIFGRV